MSVSTNLAQNTRFKFGWIILLASAALMTLGHLSMIFVLDELNLFAAFAAFTLYAFLVILIPFRQVEKWAWLSTWILPVGLAVPAATDPDIAIYYFGIAAVCVLGLLLTRQDFFKKD